MTDSYNNLQLLRSCAKDRTKLF